MNKLIFAVLVLVFMSGCAFTPKPVFLIDKYSDAAKLPDNGLKVSLIVKDTRPDSIQRTHMCGIMRNTYMMPTSIAFLAHKESLEEIVARNAKAILEKAGYSVLKVSPSVKTDLSTDKLVAPPGDSSYKSAMKDNSDDNKAELKLAKEESAGAVKVSNLSDLSEFKSAIDKELITGVDAVIELKIDKYSSDVIQAFVFVAVQGWAKLKVAALKPDDNERTVLTGKMISGYGTSGPRQIISEDCYIVAVNMSHWAVLNEFEKFIRSDEFISAVKKVKVSNL